MSLLSVYSRIKCESKRGAWLFLRHRTCGAERECAERVRAAVRCTHISAQRWPALPSSQPEIDDVEICEHMLRASVSTFISMLNYPRGAELPGNCRLPLLVLSSWILVLRRGWSYRLMFQLFHFAHLQLWLCFSNGTPVHTWPQYRQGVSTNAAGGDVWARVPLFTVRRGWREFRVKANVHVILLQGK